MTQPAPEESPIADIGANRGIGELLLAVLAGSALAPFVQAIATKTGDDVHEKIKNLLARRRGTQPKPGNSITLADPRSAIVLELPATLSVKDARELANVPTPAIPATQWLLVRHDPASQRWIAIAIPTPPAEAIQIDNHDEQI